MARPIDPLSALKKLPTSSVDATVDALAGIWRARGGQGRRAAPYAAAREHLSRHERARTRDDAVTAAMLDQIRARAPAPRSATAVQATVAVAAQLGGTATARFLVANPGRTPATVRFRPSELVRSDGETWWAPLGITPARPQLAPEAEQPVRLDIDLRACPWRDPCEATLVVDVDVDDALAMKLWVELRLAGA